MALDRQAWHERSCSAGTGSHPAAEHAADIENQTLKGDAPRRANFRMVGNLEVIQDWPSKLDQYPPLL